MIRKVVVGSGLLAFVPTVSAAAPIESTNALSKPPLMKPSDLPIYESPHAEYAESAEAQLVDKKASYLREVLVEPVRATRETLQTGWAHTDAAVASVTDQIKDLRDRTDWMVKYLREEENKEIRYGAVAMGGLTGFIFGLRGGFFRRVIYASAGTTAMGAVCFPEQTSELLASNGALLRQYVNIAYNFLYGVKPGDPQLEVKFPELSFPKNLSEVVDLTVSVASTVKQAVMPPPAKEEAIKETKPEEKKDKKS